MKDHTLEHTKHLNSQFKNMNAKVEWKTSIHSCNKKCKRCKEKNGCTESYLSDVDAYVQIYDCNDNIKLDFDLRGDTTGTEKYKKNNLYKINCLIRELKKFKKEYIKQIEIMEDNIKFLKDKENEEI